jgi:tRNA dimethylallyltransferase
MTAVVAIMGATATGKSGVAVRLAEAYGGEVVSMDSRQVYRGFDIGTAKPSLEERRGIPHHLIDILDPGETHSAGRHVRLVGAAITDISGRRRLPILAGGTGLYIRAFFDGLIDTRVPDDELLPIRRELDAKTTEEMYETLETIDPERAAALSPSDRVRISRALEVYLTTGITVTEHFAEQKRRQTGERAEGGALRIVLTLQRPVLRERIGQRTKAMYRAGWVREVRALLDRGWGLESPAMNSLGYRTIAEAILRGRDPEATLPRVVTLTQQYAKRQETFFRGMPAAQWVDMGRDDAWQAIARLVEALPGRPSL